MDKNYNLILTYHKGSCMKTLKLRSNIFLYVLISLLSTQLFAQNTYYVSTSGNDGNDGSAANPWKTIQGAISNTSVVNGDTIIVRDGTYNENVDVNKEITLKSENGYLATTVTAVNYDDRVIEILSDNVTIDGFTAYGATSNGDNIASIHLSGRTNCKILNNRCGVDATKYSYRSIMLRNSDNCLISNNICDYSPWEGILLYQGSDNNEIRNNTCRYNNWGISNTGQNNTLRGNICENNTNYGVYLTDGTADLGASSSDRGGNTFRNNNGQYDVYNRTGTPMKAYYNYWGSTDSTTIDSHIYDNEEGSTEVYFDPWDDGGLPVELTTFTARVNKNSVLLNWQTATEVNNYGFSVERLAKSHETSNNTPNNSFLRGENKEVWKTLDLMQGHGNSNSPKFYEYSDKTVNSGKYLYRLKQIDIDGGFKYSETVEADLGMPYKFELYQNYPNPFNPTTTIQYTIPNLTHPLISSREGKERSDSGVLQNITLKIYDILGNDITTLVNEEKQPGVYEVQFDASKLASGIYYYKISVDNFIQTKKMILLK